MKFQVGTSYSFRDMARTKIKCEKLQRAITPEICKQKLWFMCTALLLNEIYLPMKFQVGTSHSFRDMARTKIKYEKITKGNNSEIMTARVMVLVHCTSSR